MLAKLANVAKTELPSLVPPRCAPEAREAVAGHEVAEVLRRLRAREVDEGVPEVAVVLEVHREVEVVVPAGRERGKQP